ncbi:MAG: CBS domain-containing protein [Thermotaleaceae bacterium]
MFVSNCMNTNVISIGPEDSVMNGLYLMLQYNISGLPVMNKNKEIVGIISKSDIYKKQNQKSEDLKSVKIRERMTQEVYTITPNISLYEAVDMMTKYGINRIPVQMKGIVVGIITRTDIINYWATLQQQGA